MIFELAIVVLMDSSSLTSYLMGTIWPPIPKNRDENPMSTQHFQIQFHSMWKKRKQIRDHMLKKTTRTDQSFLMKKTSQLSIKYASNKVQTSVSEL
jgi:type III secretory pathway component EscR